MAKNWTNAARAGATDEELVCGAQAGDVKAFERLIERYFGMVHSIAYVRLRHRETAEDLAQEVFLSAFLHLNTIRDKRHFAAWIGQIARNLAFHWKRESARLPLTVSLQDEATPEIPDLNEKEPRNLMEQQDKIRLVRDAIFQLPPEQAEIVMLRFAEELGTDEIAQRLDIHATTVRRRLEKALETMKESLRPLLPEIAPHLLPPREAAIRTIRLVGAVAVLSPLPPHAELKSASATRNHEIIPAPSAPGAELVSASADPGKLWIAGLTVRTAYWWAYRTTPGRIVMPQELAQTRYNITLETDQHDREGLYPGLQQVLARQFGLSARWEKRETNAYVLTSVAETSPGLRPPEGALQFMKLDNRAGSSCRSSRLQCLIIDLEDNLNLPVIDQTGFDGSYDWDLEWDSDSAPQSILEAVRDQLGLDLSPGRQTVDMLVLEKTK